MRKRIDNTDCHCLIIRRSAENVIRFYDDVLAPSGITVRQQSLLHAISGHEGCNVRELSELTELDRSTLARSLKPLLSAGLIYDAKEKNARDSMLFLSEKGREVYDNAAKLWAEAQKQYEEKIGIEKIRTLEEILETLQYL